MTFSFHFSSTMYSPIPFVACLILAVLASTHAIPRIQESRPYKHQAFINTTKSLYRSHRPHRQTCTPRVFPLNSSLLTQLLDPREVMILALDRLPKTLSLENIDLSHGLFSSPWPEFEVTKSFKVPTASAWSTLFERDNWTNHYLKRKSGAQKMYYPTQRPSRRAA